RIVAAHLVAGGEHQVGLAQARAPVQQQRVVGTLARLLGRLPGGGAAELVAAALDEVVGGVVVVEVAVEGGAAGGRTGGGRGGGGRGPYGPGGAGQGPDFERDVATAAEEAQQFADPRHVALV